MKKILFVVLLFAFMCPFSAKAIDYDTYWINTIHGGIVCPVGAFAQSVNVSYGGGISIRKGLDMETSAGGGISYCVMPYKDNTAPTSFSASVLDIEFAFAPYMPDYFLWPYIKGGIGLYMVRYSELTSLNNSQANTENTFGFILGGGVNYPLGSNLAINLEVLYNNVALAGGTGDTDSFVTINLGLTIFMK